MWRIPYAPPANPARSSSAYSRIPPTLLPIVREQR
ncbi:hypothetical protein OROMI_030005 [Orobanche minor]